MQGTLPLIAGPVGLQYEGQRHQADHCGARLSWFPALPLPIRATLANKLTAPNSFLMCKSSVKL